MVINLKSFNILDLVKSAIEVEVEGYFVERYINLCRSSNLEIWDIKQLTVGKIRCTTRAKNLKAMRKIIRKSRCKLKIVNKKGIYFKIFKYRKRRIALYLSLVLIIAIYISTRFIWKINIMGSTSISDDEIYGCLKELGVKPGMFIKKLDKSHISDALRAKYYNIAWVGVEIDGINLELQIIEKNLDNLKDEHEQIGNIVSNINATITNIVATNGTPMLKKGDIVNVGDVLIEGKIYYINQEPLEVHASGIVKGMVSYEYTREYKYIEQIKEYTGNKKRGISFYINTKEFELNYLPKHYIYDITKVEKKINLLGCTLGVGYNEYCQYRNSEVKHTKEELQKLADNEFQRHLSDFLAQNATRVLIDTIINVQETKDGITYSVKYYCEEEIGEFLKN